MSFPTSPWRTCYVTHDTTMAPMSPMTQTWNQWHHHGNNDTTLSWAGKGQFWCKTMAQYGTVCSICLPHLTMTYMLCHPWHHDGTHVTYDTDMESMTPSWQQWHHTVLELGKDNSGVKQWHNMAQYVIYVIPTSPWRTCYVTHDTTMAPMSPMTQTWNQWHHHGNNDTTLSWKGRFWWKDNGTNSHCPGAGKGHGTVCSICLPHLTMTYMLCHPWQWHPIWHGINVCTPHCICLVPTSPWRTCYVTHDTTMAPMSPMTQTWNQWHHHGNNDTTLSWAGKGQFWCKTMAQYGTVCSICHPHLTMTYMLCHPWHHDGTHVTYDTDMESMTPSWQQWHHTVLSWERTILV